MYRNKLRNYLGISKGVKTKKRINLSTWTVSPEWSLSERKKQNCILAEISAKYNVKVGGVFTALFAQVALANSQIVSNEGRKKRRSEPDCAISWVDKEKETIIKWSTSGLFMDL